MRMAWGHATAAILSSGGTHGGSPHFPFLFAVHCIFPSFHSDVYNYAPSLEFCTLHITHFADIRGSYGAI